MQCVCGSTEARDTAIRHGRRVNAAGESRPAKIHILACTKCGLVRQKGLRFENEAAWARYYREEYPPLTSEYAEKPYRHDREVAVKRCDEYGPCNVQGRMLDVGSGSGAFVDEARDRGAEAYGCEIGRYADAGMADRKYVYRGQLSEINFPTDYFDTVTCHDVVEHVLDPRALIEEMLRITKQHGTCIIDLPRFHHSSGAHHWKDREHIWFFTEEQFEKLLNDAGFVVDTLEHPIPSKVVFYATKPPQTRVKVLLPPGIGDCYWPLVKLEALMAAKGIKPPVDAYVASNRDKLYEGHKRSFPFLEMFPFLNATGVTMSTRQATPRTRAPGHARRLRRLAGIVDKSVWQEAYAERGRNIFEDVLGCDYFIAYNGRLGFGERLEDINPELACNWIPRRFVSIEEEDYRREAVAYGRYIVLYFIFQGTYKSWLKEFPKTEIATFARSLQAATGCKPVFVGALWDRQRDHVLTTIRQEKGVIDLVGHTSVAQAFGLMRGAEAVVGFPSGLTIASAMLGCPTLTVWNKYYNEAFRWNCVPPSVREKTYFIEDTAGLTADKLTGRVKKLLSLNPSGWGKLIAAFEDGGSVTLTSGSRG